jgi:hypothetical protein
METVDHGDHIEVTDVPDPAKMRENYLRYYGDKVGTFMADVVDLAVKQGIGGVMMAVAADDTVVMNAFSLDPRCRVTIDRCAEAFAKWMAKQSGHSMLPRPGPAGHG